MTDSTDTPDLRRRGLVATLGFAAAAPVMPVASVAKLAVPAMQAAAPVVLPGSAQLRDALAVALKREMYEQGARILGVDALDEHQELLLHIANKCSWGISYGLGASSHNYLASLNDGLEQIVDKPDVSLLKDSKKFGHVFYDAHRMLEQWQAIAAVYPKLEHEQMRLLLLDERVNEKGSEQTVLTPEEWQTFKHEVVRLRSLLGLAPDCKAQDIYNALSERLNKSFRGAMRIAQNGAIHATNRREAMEAEKLYECLSSSISYIPAPDNRETLSNRLWELDEMISERLHEFKGPKAIRRDNTTALKERVGLKRGQGIRCDITKEYSKGSYIDPWKEAGNGDGREAQHYVIRTKSTHDLTAMHMRKLTRRLVAASGTNAEDAVFGDTRITADFAKDSPQQSKLHVVTRDTTLGAYLDRCASLNAIWLPHLEHSKPLQR